MKTIVTRSFASILFLVLITAGTAHGQSAQARRRISCRLLTPKTSSINYLPAATVKELSVRWIDGTSMSRPLLDSQ